MITNLKLNTTVLTPSPAKLKTGIMSSFKGQVGGFVFEGSVRLCKPLPKTISSKDKAISRM